MPTSDGTRTKVVVVVGVVVIAIATAACGGAATSSSAAPLSPSASVLSVQYAKSIGFPKTVQAAKKTAETHQKGCPHIVTAAYENAASETVLASEVLECGTEASATSALATVRKQVTIDPTLTPPKALGGSAFATTNAGEYLMVWRSGTRVAITAINIDSTPSSSTPSSSTPSTPAPLTTAQIQTLGQAALHQNSLYP